MSTAPITEPQRRVLLRIHDRDAYWSPQERASLESLRRKGLVQLLPYTHGYCLTHDGRKFLEALTP